MATQARRRFRFNFRGSLCMPFAVFMLLFVIFPLALIIYFAFTDSSGHLYLDNWGKIFTDGTKWLVIGRTFLIAFLTTFFCILIAYPIAFILSNSKINKNKVLVYLFILPMWVNFVLRTMALRDMVNWLTSSLFQFQLTSQYPLVGVVVGMVYDYLPFAILPLYNQMLKMDKNQIEAAADLGANPVQVFFKSVVPQSIPGIVSATTMTFMPTMSSYVISDTLSEGKITLFGNYIYLDFANNLWHDGSFMALIMLVIIGISMLLTRNSGKEEKEGGAAW